MKLSPQLSFNDLPLGLLDRQVEPIYIIDYEWNYLYVNHAAKARLKDIDIVGKHISSVWERFPEYNFEPVFSQLYRYVEQKFEFETLIPSPISGTNVLVKGQPFTDCFLFSIIPNTSAF